MQNTAMAKYLLLFQENLRGSKKLISSSCTKYYYICFIPNNEKLSLKFKLSAYFLSSWFTFTKQQKRRPEKAQGHEGFDPNKRIKSYCHVPFKQHPIISATYT